MTPTLRANLGYSMLLTAANYLFPLVVYMHISRVLGVANIGLVGFVDSVTVYFILFSMMGISVLGMKAISQARGDTQKLAETFRSLLALHASFTLVVLAAMIAATFLVDELRANWQLMCVGMCKLVFNVFLVEWLFTGLERFRFIAMRTLIVKGLYAGAVFMLVQNPDDTLTYYVLTMLVVAALAVINMMCARHTVRATGLRLHIRQFVRPFFSLGLYSVVTASYATFNMAFLGFVANDESVGYFSTAAKIVSLVAVVFTAYISVVAPRASRLLAQGDNIRFRSLAVKSVWAILAIGIPVAVVAFALAPQLVEFLSGPGYQGAVAPLRILAPALIIIGMSQLINVQILVPLGQENRVALASAVGFAVCLAVNILFTPRLSELGAAIAWVAGECTTLILCLAITGRDSSFIHR